MRSKSGLRTVVEPIFSLIFVPALAVATHNTRAQANQPQGPVKESQKVEATQKDVAQSSETTDTVVVSESPYLRAVRDFADNVLKYGRDTYGPKHTPLFVDGLNTETLDPVVWRNKGEKWILSNFANHQSLLRLLDGLTVLTGEGKYRQAAVEASAYALTHLRTRNGLLYWGGHLGWDLQREKGVSEGRFDAHELREQSPYYELLWEANPSETKRLMETIWGAHVLDWSKLDFNRHSSSTTEPRPAQWTHEFDENLSCPFPSVGNNWSMANIAGSLLQTSASLAKLGEHREALIWTKRLAQRWHSARHPLTGLCGGLLSVPQEKRAYKFLGHKHPNISDATMIAGSLMDSRYRILTLCQMQVGEELGDNGLDLIRWASDDLKAFARYAYDEESLSFRPLLTDGTELKWREFNPGYYSPQGLAPLKVSSGMLWAYATAYRLTRDPAHWKLLRSVWRGFDLGDLGTETGDGRHLNLELEATSYLFLYACLDLHIATEDKAFLMLAQRVGGNILAARTQDRCLPKDYFYVRTGDEAMLAILHLAATLQGKSHKIPQPKVDRQYFHCAFSGAVGSGRTVTDARVWDQSLIYSKRKEYSILPAGSTEPPISIGEAISMGNMEIVRALYSQRTDFEDMHSLLFPAVQSSHKDAVEFFLAKGANVNSMNGWQEETPLHHAAALKDGREIIELLIDKGADLNAKNWKGDTPLQYAAYYDHEKISELLLQKGAKITNLHIASYMGDLGRAEAFIKEGVDISARDGHGYVPLHYAARERQEQAIELLLASGADLEAKNWEGRTPFALAIERGHKDIAELLANKGADVNSADNEGSALLHRTVQNGQGDVAAFLIDEGVDVNTKNNKGYTPLYEAVWNSDANMVELLVLNGADVDAKDKSGYIPLSWAIWNEDRDMIKLLVSNGADVNFVGEDDWPFLHYVAEMNDRELVELLLAHGAKLNVKDDKSRTELHIALSEGHRDMVEFLVSKGATAPELHLAACLGDLGRVKSLVEEGADVDTKDEIGWTPLHWAVSMAEEEVAEFLIGEGADVDFRTNNNRTLLHQAATAGAAKLASLLISKGADSNARDEDNGTPLHSAAAGGHKDVVELLLANGADVSAKDNQGRTPLDLAKRRGHAEIIEILTKAAEKQKTDSSNARRPANDGELRYWLENMVWYHRFANAEITAATGLTNGEIVAAMKKSGIRRDNRPAPNKDGALMVLPYPGGRHPRIGFLEGAIDPQRETKFSVFAPWDRDSYVVVDVPEAIWSNLGLTYLAHTHIDTIWSKQGVTLAKLEWKRGADGTLDIERELPNGIAFGVKVRPTKEAVLMEIWLRNGTKQHLSDLRVQNCVMTKMAAGFEQQTNDNKVFTNPYAACRSDDGKHWIITAWEGCHRPWGNKDCPCFHSDPKFPDLEPGQTAHLRGWLSFYEGSDIEAEFKRIEAAGWRTQ